MVKHKYGEFSREQMIETKRKLRQKIFYLLVACENEIAKQREEERISVDEAFQDVFNEVNGLNDLLGYPVEFVELLSLLNEAHIEYKSPEFSFPIYRKLVLDAGASVKRIKEV